MNEKKIVENLVQFSDELGMIGLKISKEIYGQTYLEEEDLQQRIGHIFLKKNYPVLREVGLPKKVFDVTFKKGEFPDFVFFDNPGSDFLAPFLIEFKHQDKITDQFRSQLGRQLNLAQETVVNNNKNLKYGFVWNIVKTDFESLNKSFNPSVQNATITNGVSMKIKKPDVRVEVELWKLTNGKNHELGIELIERKTYG